MIIVDAPDRDFSSNDQWLRFLAEMKQTLKKVDRYDDIKQVSDLIARARAVLDERNIEEDVG